MKSNFQKTLDAINEGLLGNNTGVPFGLEKLSQYTPNIQKKRFVTIAAGSGVGKTSLALYMYIYSAYEAIIKDPSIDYKCIFYTMEIDTVSAMGKLISIKLFKDYKIIVDPDLIFSSNAKRKLPENVYKLILTLTEYFEKLEDYVEFIPDPINPTGASRKVEEEMLKCGTKQYYNSKKIPCDKNDPDKTTFEYTPNNPKQIRVFMFDHSDCLKGELTHVTSKAKIDLFCEKAVYARNKYGATFVVLSQLNRALETATRTMHTAKDKNYELLLPNSSDLKGTGNLYESSDLVLYAFDPSSYNIANFMGYDISRLKERFRILGIMKNRYGKSNIQAGYGFVGESNVFIDIPSPAMMKENHYTYFSNLKSYV